MNVSLKGSHLLGTVALMGLLGSCAADNPWGTESGSKGKIHLTLQTDGDVKSARPVFRSGEDGVQVSDYLTVPTAGDFKIKLEKKDGTYSGFFGSIDELNNSNEAFTAGAYTLTAYHGEKGTQGFDCPYFEGSAELTVLSDKTTDIDVTAAMANSMIALEYTQEFINYMSAWDATIYTEGVTGGIRYPFDERRAAFVEPNNVSIGLSFTTKEGKSTTVSIGSEFAPLAKTLYHITIDVKAKETGDAALSITFDDSLEEVPVEIDLTEELFTTPAPTIETVGFADGETIDMLEGTASEETLKMNVVAKAGLAKAILTINSDNYTAPWGKEIDLCSATEAQQAQLAKAGISAVGFYKNPDKLAFLDLTAFGNSLPKGTHTIQLRVEDAKGATSEAASVTLDSQDITINAVDQYILYGSNEATMTLDYNGTEPEKNISFRSINEAGNMKPVSIKKCELATGTRAFETKRYIFTIALLESTHEVIRIDAYHKENLIGSFNVPVTTPEYTIAADAYTNTADIKVNSSNVTVEAAIVNNLKVRMQDGDELTVAARNTGTGILTLSGLSPITPYIIETSLDGENWGHQKGFTTESELQIPNGDFSQTTQTINITEIDAGGQYKYGATTMQNKSSITVNEPTGWASINSKTCWIGSNPQNTWFMVPSTIATNGKVLIRSVAYDHAGTLPALDNHGLKVLAKYSRNKPASFANKEAGELFLGEYSFNGSENRSEGIAFSSRPMTLSFDYTYAPVSNENGEVTLRVIDASGNVIASTDASISTGTNTSKTVSLSYSASAFGKKAAKLYVSFRSTKGSSVTVPIPSDIKDVSNTTELSGQTIGANQYKSLCVGSQLTIDNVKVGYDRLGSASGAPKRKTSTTAKK